MGLIVERRGERQHFDERVLYASVYHVFKLEDCSSTEAEERAEAITSEIKQWIRREHDKVVSAGELRHKAKERIEERDDDAAEMYKRECDVEDF